MKALEQALVRRLRNMYPHEPPKAVQAIADAVTKTGAFGLATDGTLALVGEPPQIKAARQVSRALVEGMAFSQPTEQKPDQDPIARVDERLRRMGLGSFDQAYADVGEHGFDSLDGGNDPEAA